MMAPRSFCIRLLAIILFATTLCDCYQSLERVIDRLDVIEEEAKETGEETSQAIKDLEEDLKRESRYRREDIKAEYEVLKQLQGANATRSVAVMPGHERVNTCEPCVKEETPHFVLLLKAFKREKQINAHLRQELRDFQNKLEFKIVNLSKDTVNNVAEEMSALDAFRDRLNDSVTVAVRGVEQRLLFQLDQETSSIFTTISEVNANLTAINVSLSNDIGRCFEEVFNQTKTVDKLIGSGFDQSNQLTSCNQSMSNVSKVYDVFFEEINQTVPVFCDVHTEGGGWIVFQRRKDTSVDFYRTWEEYKLGFGDLSGNFWWGNEKLHHMTWGKSRELRIDLEDFDGNKAFAEYSTFRIHSKEQNCKLEVDGYSGTAGDALDYKDKTSWNHDGQEFSTRDRDNTLGRMCQKRVIWGERCKNHQTFRK